MNALIDVRDHLRTEISAPDPWQLASNTFEHLRYAIMLNMIRARGPFRRGLEIGCAAGFFTKLLADHCASLHVVDVLPEAIARAAAHVGPRSGLTWETASAAEDFAPGETFDLIVIAEVLAYLPDIETLRATVARLSSRLAPGGLLVFGSAVNSTCERWGLTAGAETIMKEWDKTMRELDRTACRGSYWGENCIITAYTPADDRPIPGDLARGLQEVSLIPYKPVQCIPAAAVLVLAPHPDDEVYGCGGAILRHQENGVPTRVIVVSDGGGGLAGAERAACIRQRREESRAAAKIMGYGEPMFWNLADRTLEYGEALVGRIVAAIGDADLVYAPAPSELHPDHRNLAMAAIEAVRRTGRGARLALYEISAPLRANVLVDISTLVERKQAAMACFGSQLQRQKYDLQISSLNRFRTYTLPAHVAAAEAYHLVSAEELNADPLKFHWRENDRHFADGAERALRRALAEMRNSTSWKITAPLRSASRTLRKFLHDGPPALTVPLRGTLKLLRTVYHRAYRSA
jgi:LmbE family N-acetylglucosaminyl deacetylase/2-polyprenyl-3-methyl-5-hydroxy-6-metoxy-1,4-benzoquinol methylase